jgi:CrcB protein
MTQLFWICLGSAAGGGARHLVSGWALRALGPGFPHGTLIVNVAGSFLIAVVMFAGVERGVISPTLRLALTTGVLGGFTTYSSFSYETMRSMQEGAWGVAAANVAITTVACLAACLLGWAAARWALGG